MNNPALKVLSGREVCVNKIYLGRQINDLVEASKASLEFLYFSREARSCSAVYQSDKGEVEIIRNGLDFYLIVDGIRRLLCGELPKNLFKALQ